jgi:hypothetical protein
MFRHFTTVHGRGATRGVRWIHAFIMSAFLAACACGADIRGVVTTVMQSGEDLHGVRFAEVVEAATGRKVIPLSRSNAVDQALVAKIGRALDDVLKELNAPGSPVRQKRRINEVSSLFEDGIKAALNKVPGFECDFPKLADGGHQRSGYPDLRLFDKATRRVVYLDPKLFERGSRGSSFRTFYFEPKRETNKILDDAHHLIVGFEHDGRTGEWKFMDWELVDLAEFRVKLKAEFQASNRDLYKPEAVVGSSRAAAK